MYRSANWLSLLGIARVPVVLLPDRDDDLVDERIAEPRDLDQRPVGVERPVTAEDPDLRPACAGVDPDRPVRERSLEQVRLRNLDRNRVRVVVQHAVSSRVVREREGMQGVERPQATEIEDRSQVDEERIVARTRRRPCGCRRGRRRPDTGHTSPSWSVARCSWAARRGANRERRARLRHPRDGVRLLDAQVVSLVRRRVDRPGVVEEGVRIRHLRLESEVVRDVFAPVAVVVDVQGVENGRIEPVVVRAARRILERDVVRDDRDGVRVVRAHERVDVRVVGSRIVRDQRSFPVARGLRPRWPDRADERRSDHSGRDCRAEREEQYSPLHADLLSPL